MNYNLLIESMEKHVPLKESEKAILTQTGTLQTYKRGQFLVQQGDINRSWFFVNQGSVRAYYITPNGHEHTVRIAVEGWWISDLQSFSQQRPAAILHLQTLEPCQIIEFNYETVQALYDQVPPFERYVRILTQRAFAAYQERILQNLSMDAQDRYLAFQRQFPKLDLRLSQKVIASYLGISAEFMSKIRKRVARLQPEPVVKRLPSTKVGRGLTAGAPIDCRHDQFTKGSYWTANSLTKPC